MYCHLEKTFTVWLSSIIVFCFNIDKNFIINFSIDSNIQKNVLHCYQHVAIKLVELSIFFCTKNNFKTYYETQHMLCSERQTRTIAHWKRKIKKYFYKNKQNQFIEIITHKISFQKQKYSIIVRSINKAKSIIPSITSNAENMQKTID